MSKTVFVTWFAAFAVMFSAPSRADEVKVSRDAYSLQAQQKGDGKTAVVFESGFGQGADVWKDVIADLGAEFHCIAYARAGLGTSGTDGKPKTIQEHLQDLGGLMDALAPNRKVILVGHSYGGLLATEFARLHPDRVEGLVLVDPTTWSQRHAFKKANSARVLADDKTLLAMLPPAMVQDYKLLVAQLDSESAIAPHPQPDVPVALLTSTQVSPEPFVLEETEQGKAIWKRQHALLFAEFSHGTHQYFATGHNIHRENPEAVADDVRSVAAMTTGAHK